MSRAATLPVSVSFRTAARTHVGLLRSLNEDAFVARPETGLWAVADGMGGHQAGDLASKAIVDALGGLGQVASAYAHLNRARERVEAINQALLDRAAALPAGSVIGSTVVCLLVHEDHYACIWAGDSRAYRLRGGALSRISHDHSLVQEMIDKGALSEGEAGARRIANVITRAVGADAQLKLDEAHGEVRAGDLFLLCSDGVTGLVSDAELADLLTTPDLEGTADALLDLTLARGAKDNVTFILVRAERAAF